MAPQQPVSIEEVSEAATSLLNLLQSFAASLHPSNNHAPPPSLTTDTAVPEPLALLDTAAKLLRAQTTKLSLLLINEPFTPSAIKTMLSEMSSQTTPALYAAAQSCAADTLGRTMRDEARARARRTLVELAHLVKEVQTKAASKAPETASHTAPPAATKRDALASTGVVWSACDAASALRTLGIAGLLSERAASHRATLDDAASELRDWRDDADDEGFESGSDDAAAADADADASSTLDASDADAGAADTAAALERALGAAHRLPSARADLRTLLDAALRRLRLAGTLCAAASKRRLSVLDGAAATRANLERADAAEGALRRLPHVADEMAARFYVLDEPGAREMVDALSREGRAVVEALRLGWDAQPDEFTGWCERWVSAMDDAAAAAAAAAAVGEAGEVAPVVGESVEAQTQAQTVPEVS